MKKILLLLLFNNILWANTTDNTTPDIKTAIGSGVNYGGVIGVQGYTELSNEIDVFASLGYLEGIGYAIGTRYKIDDNIRFTLNYGTNSVVETCDFDCLTKEYERYAGFNMGVGYLWSNGWHLDLMYLETSDGQDAQERGKEKGNVYDNDIKNSFKLSFGYNF